MPCLPTSAPSRRTKNVRRRRGGAKACISTWVAIKTYRFSNTVFNREPATVPSPFPLPFPLALPFPLLLATACSSFSSSPLLSDNLSFFSVLKRNPPFLFLFLFLLVALPLPRPFALLSLSLSLLGHNDTTLITCGSRRKNSERTVYS